MFQEFTSRPDVADDCFLLASRCIRYCPQLFMPSSIFPSLVDCAMIGITVQHRSNPLFRSHLHSMSRLGYMLVFLSASIGVNFSQKTEESIYQFINFLYIH